jgi:putative toxin-antitoxin system antitoxin component (TIGR02293 family)
MLAKVVCKACFSGTKTKGKLAFSEWQFYNSPVKPAARKQRSAPRDKAVSKLPSSAVPELGEESDGGENSVAQIAAIRKGYDASVVDRVAEAIGVPRKCLAEALRLADRTVRHRAKLGQRLTAGESEKILRVQQVYAKAVEALESAEAARAWLVTPAQGLGNVCPLEFLDTGLGFREVTNLLAAIEWSNYY